MEYSATTNKLTKKIDFLNIWFCEQLFIICNRMANLTKNKHFDYHH